MNDGSLPSVLVVDDSPDNLKLMSSLLKDFYRVKIAKGGEQALSIAISDSPPDLILLDIMMPGMDGYEVCRRLKANPTTAEIPVIFLTAKTETEDEELGFSVGAVDYILKPISSSIVLARVKTQLALRKALLQAISAQKEADKLLHCLLPDEAAEEIRTIGTVIPRRHENVAVLFCDLANFTSYCDKNEPEDVVARLDALFVQYEQIISRHGLEKIKTVGDAFMAAANLLFPNDDPIASAVRCGLEMEQATDAIGLGWSARVGVDAGPVVAGVVGQERFQFDIWGNTVNVAARMAAKSEFGTVAITEDIWAKISNRFTSSSSARHEVKGKGEINIFQVQGQQ